ncbi:MAG: NAD(P)/FAD-dependent oxidoreductase [Deltaproteobacteria bacterium]|jgi:flavin-dependent dehydrogenase|nr:NAD(P)/FAD-dependent oxidoreductase [Deltaproteobacteria bacterium]
MHDFDVIIVGGGPAGAACARELLRQGVNAAILDKADFPRLKLCAGWITPEVFKDLKCSANDYPHGIICFKKIYFHIAGIKLPLKTRQYSIRRVEFDDWLLKKSEVQIFKQRVKKIEKKKNQFIVDEKFRAKFIVGAGGTNCPVARIFFRNRADKSIDRQIIALEKEFKTDYSVKECHLWFVKNRLPGYSWFVPKAGGYLNIGVGGKLDKLNRNKTTINEHWNSFINRLKETGKIPNTKIRPKGYIYNLKKKSLQCHKDNAFIIGDALGLATLDMGEGIGPAVKSGILAAKAITSGKEYNPDTISKLSLPSMFMAGLKF